MEMGMEDDLACGSEIIHLEIIPFSASRLHHSDSHFFRDYHERAESALRDVSQRHMMRFRDDEGMSLIHRPDIKESIAQVILKYF